MPPNFFTDQTGVDTGVTQPFRCPNCQHWRCRDCDDQKAYQLRCCLCGEVALAFKWYMGEAMGHPHDLEQSPRLGIGRPHPRAGQLF